MPCAKSYKKINFIIFKYNPIPAAISPKIHQPEQHLVDVFPMN